MKMKNITTTHIVRDCFDMDEIIHDYYYKPEPIFYGDGPRYLGVELELDDGGENEFCASKLLDIANAQKEHMYIKHDGSLDDGFECVTHPMTLDYHINQMPWRAILNKAVAKGYLSHQAGTCGLHVHISRNALGANYEEQEATIAKILYFYEKFWNEILTFSRRTESTSRTLGKTLRRRNNQSERNIKARKEFTYGTICGGQS